MAPQGILVVGIDFGTTYSGISWATTDRPGERVLINNWPTSRENPTGRSYPKVPTQLLYSNRGYFEWGYQIPYEAEPKDVVSLFKLGLEPNRLARSGEAAGKFIDFKNPDQNATDYLSGLFEHFNFSIRRQLGHDIYRNYQVQFVLTVPAIWSDATKQRTIEAFKQVPNLPDGHTVTLVSEPEAASIAALQELDPHDLKVNDSFVVVDAGGGTVDLITHTIKALRPALELVEATKGSGNFCGSTLLNEKFARLLVSRLEREEGWNEDVLRYALDHFETVTKRTFSVDALTQQKVFDIPVPTLKPNVDVGINSTGHFSLPAHVLHIIFEPSVVTTIGLVKEQINLAKVPIRRILMVGGYGSSTYLRERLQIALQGDPSTRDIEILQPPNSWTCVATGAVLTGLSLANPVNYDMPMVKARRARKHYGYEIGVFFDDAKHESLRPKRYYDGHSGHWRVLAMDWRIKRDELVFVDKPFLMTYFACRPVSFGRPEEISLRVYADQVSNEAPLARNNNVQLLCHVTADLKHIPEHQLDKERGADGKMYYFAEFQVEAIYRTAMTEYTLIHKGHRYATMEAEYVHT